MTPAAAAGDQAAAAALARTAGAHPRAARNQRHARGRGGGRRDRPRPGSDQRERPSAVTLKRSRGDADDVPETPTSQPADDVSVEMEDAWTETSDALGRRLLVADDDDRQQESPDERGETLQEHLLWQLEMAKLDARERAIGRAIIDAINDDGYLTEPCARHRRAPCSPRPGPERGRNRARAAGRADARPAGRRRAHAERMPACCSCARSTPDTPGLRAALAIARDHLDLVAEREHGHAAPRARVSTRRSCSWRWCWCAAAIRAPARRSAPRSRNTSCPTCSCGAREHGWTVEMNAGTLPRRCASTRATPASSAAPPTTPPCARSCRRPAGCSRAWRSATTRC